MRWRASPRKLRELPAPHLRSHRRRWGKVSCERVLSRGSLMHSADDWKIRAVLRSTIRARRMQKDQPRAAHTIPPSHTGRQASSRRPYCHKESAVASGEPNLSGRELTERHRRLCVSETSLSAPPIEAQGSQQACRQPCDCACGAFCLGSNQSKQTLLLSWPWPRRG
jgi:hypothetical protein